MVPAGTKSAPPSVNFWPDVFTYPVAVETGAEVVVEVVDTLLVVVDALEVVDVEEALVVVDEWAVVVDPGKHCE